MIWRCWRRAIKETVHAAKPWLLDRGITAPELERLGSDYGGWEVPIQLVKPGAICYCVGVGIDASFDMALAGRFGCEVYSFDPTPMAIEYMRTLPLEGRRHRFLPWGVWKEDTTLKFFVPANPREHSNLSMFDLHGTGGYVSAPCKRLSTIMRELGHDHVHLLKLDIEGGWSEVIQTLVDDDVRPDIVCIEFDSPVTWRRLIRAIGHLRELGMALIAITKDNYLFVQRELLVVERRDSHIRGVELPAEATRTP